MKFEYTANVQMTFVIEFDADTAEDADEMAEEWFNRKSLMDDGWFESGYELIRSKSDGNDDYWEVLREGL